MKTAAIFFFLVVFINPVYTGTNLEFGAFAGTSYYLGNINTSQHFYNLSPAFGVLSKYNIDEHYTLRASLNYGQIKASDLDFNNILHQTRSAGFINNFYDLSLQGEFSFRPFRTTIFAKPFSTFITTGISYTFVQESNGTVSDYFNIPFGGGIKYGLSRRVTLGMEWILKKNFSDNIDGIKSFGQFQSRSLVHNNDWVSLAGFFITIKPFDRRGDCPAYWN